MISKSLYSFFAFSGSRVLAFTDYHLTPTQGLSQCDGEHTSVRLKISIVMAVTVLKRSIKHTSYLCTTHSPERQAYSRLAHAWCKCIFNKTVGLLCYILRSTSEAGIISKDKHIWHTYVYILLFPQAIFQTNSLYNIFTDFQYCSSHSNLFFYHKWNINKI